MKVRTMVTTLAASLLFAGAALAAEVGWNSYRDSQAGFSVEMPGYSKLWTEKMDKGVVYHRDSQAGKVLYHVTSSDVGEDVSGSEHARQNLDLLRNAILGGHHATAQSERELELNGFPGREVAFRDGEDGNYWMTRIYLVKSHLFTVSTESTDGRAADGTRFFNSFHPAAA